MIDREARDRLAKAIRRYLNEEIGAFEFDEALAIAMDGSKDRTAQAIRQALWFHYDDCKDHKIVASKKEWDYFHRLLLFLQSDEELEVRKTRRRWHPGQAVAALCLLVFILIVFRVGFGEHLFAYALPFGPVSMVIAWVNARHDRRTTPGLEVAIAPFPSIRSLFAVRRRAVGFMKARYPSSIAGRRIRDPIIERLMWIPSTLLWCMLSPVVLFFQMLPEREAEMELKTFGSEDSGESLPGRAGPSA